MAPAGLSRQALAELQAQLAALDWQAPWLRPWAATGRACLQGLAAGQGLHSALTGNATVQFVPQDALPAGEAYEAFVHRTGQVPTRPNLHDVFNAWCWQRFPLAKRQLNRVQAAEIARQGVGQRRGPVRDAITVLDENGALLQAPEPLWPLLREHRWHEALVQRRALWDQAKVWVFGHAALEKLVQPYKSITVHLWAVPPELPEAALDAWLAQDWQPERLAAKPFAPLPVLGVPGWWPDNSNPEFYANRDYFRPARNAAQSL